MTANQSGYDLQEITRRGFLSTTAVAALAGYAVLSPSTFAALLSQPRAGEFSELDANTPGGIDLYIDRQTVLVDGRPGSAVTINGSFPGPLIRMKEGEDVLIRVHNRMKDESTSIHWHGILLPHTMDGVPGISYAGIPGGETFTYRYKAVQNGTYWYHSHTGLQEQLGVYGQIVIEPAEPDPVDFDIEHTIILSDWTFENPETVLWKLKTIDSYYNFQRPTIANLGEEMKSSGKSLLGVISKRLKWDQMRMDPTDIADITGATYTFLMNGKSHEENWTAIAKPGQRVRLRLVNASTMTYYDFRIPGLPMTVVQADGQNVKPIETDELRIAVAETFDVIVTMPDDEKAFTIYAETMDRSGFVRGTLAPRQGMDAPIPERRQRPMLSMLDMGMMNMGKGKGKDMDMDMDMGEGMDMKGMDMKNMDMKNKHEKMDMSGGMSGMSDMDDMDDMDDMSKMDSMDNMGQGSSKMMMAQHEGTLPTEHLPDRITHGPDRHGPGSISMGMASFRRLDTPGIGLGNDGRRVLSYSQLRCLETPKDRRPPTREFDLHLTGNMQKYIWGFDGKKWSEADMIRFVYGERLRINMINDTMMSHPIHLHGMWMDLYAGGKYADNPRKHTVSVQPAELLTVDITVDAPGQWAFHCHLLFHMDMGMFRTVAVVRSLDGGADYANA